MTFAEMRGLREKLHDGVIGKRRTHAEKVDFDRKRESSRRISELLALLERSTTYGLSLSQLVTRGDVVALRGEAADISSLQTFLTYLVNEIEGCSASIESVRDELSEEQGSGKKFNVMITLLPAQG